MWCPQALDHKTQRVWFGGGGKRVYFGVPTEAFSGENALLGWHFAQKRQAKGLDHLMHAI